MRRSAKFFVLIAVLIGCAPASAADPVGVVTILEGDAFVIRGLSKFKLSEGVRVMADDLIETGKGTYGRIEFTDGAMSDLGSATRAQLNRPSLRRSDRPAFYLLTGWLKITAAGMSSGSKASVGSPLFDAAGLAGATVLWAEGGSGAVFAEDGPVRVTDRRTAAAVPIPLKSRDFVALRGSEAARVDARPSHEFVASLPRPFEDSIPPLIDQFKNRVVPAKPLGVFTYAEAEPWLDAEPVIRRRFVHEWVAKADEGYFRERLDAGLARHPEWERVLYPERFEPKPTVPPVAVPQSPASGGSIPRNPSVPSATPAAGTQGGPPLH